MRTTGWILALAIGAALPAHAQQGPPPGGGMGMQRRAQLEQQVLQRFVQRAGTEMALPAASRPRLAQVVRESAAERRSLNQEGMQLRRRMMLAVQDPATGNEAFEQLLVEQRRLREREHQLWDREQARLQEFLSPRQRAHFALMWQRLQDEARDVMMQRRGPPPGGGLE